MRSGLRSSRSRLSSLSALEWPRKCSSSARAPGRAGLGVAERVELEQRIDAQFLEQLVGEGEDLDIGLRLGGADDLGVELVELAKAPLLRALIAERRAVGRDLQRRVLLPPFAQISAANPGREFGPKRDRFPAAVLEGVHLLGHDVGGLADGPREHRGRLDRRHLDPLEAVQPAHALERRDHRRLAVRVFSKQALRAPDGLRRGHGRGLKHNYLWRSKPDDRAGLLPVSLRGEAAEGE